MNGGLVRGREGAINLRIWVGGRGRTNLSGILFLCEREQGGRAAMNCRERKCIERKEERSREARSHLENATGAMD